MKNIGILVVINLLGVALFQPAFAGAISGGGGSAVVCRDSNKQITKAELLDLYEGRVIYGRNIVYSLDPITSQLANAFNKTAISQQLGYDQGALEIQSKLRFVPPGTALLPVDDAIPTVIPQGCELEQLVNYMNNDAILVSQEIWDHLDITDQAAALAHESVYRVERDDFGATDSRRSRNIVSELFSDHGAFEDPSAGIPQGAYYCQGEGTLQNGTVQDTWFYLYPYQGILRLQFTRIASQMKLTKTTADIQLPGFPFSAGNFPANILSASNGAYTKAEFEDGDWMYIVEDSDGTNILGGTSGWIPQLNFVQANFHCSKNLPTGG